MSSWDKRPSVIPDWPKCRKCGGVATRSVAQGETIYAFSCVVCYDDLMEELGFGSTPHESPSLRKETDLQRAQRIHVEAAERIIWASWNKNKDGLPPLEDGPPLA